MIRSGICSDLLSVLYRSALDDRCLPQFLEACSATTDTHNVALLIQDMVSPIKSLFLTNPSSSDVSEQYVKYAEENIFLRTAVPFIKKGVILRTNTVLRDGTLKQSKFYDEFCKPTDIFHCMGATMRADPRIVVALSFCRQESAPFTERDQQWVQNLMPHLQTWLAIREKLVGLEAVTRAGWETLNSQPFGIMILNEVGKTLYANEAIHSTVRKSTLLEWRGSRLVSSRGRVTDWMASSVRRILGGLSENSRGGAIQVSGGAERLHIMIAPLVVDTLFGEQTYCAIFVSDVYSGLTGISQSLKDMYALTKKEAEIACLLIQGYRVKEIAELLKVEPSTVMTHKKRVFQKTGVNRQSQLIRIGLSLNCLPAS